MFIQVLQGTVKDEELFRRQAEAWNTEVKPAAVGYVGSTAGVTADGRAIVLARFESEEAARANSDLPEQSAWWTETAPAFEGDVEFHDCRDVDLLGAGGSDDAGFVQVMQGRAVNQEEMRRRMGEMAPQLAVARPDVIGAVCAWHGDGAFTQAIYFSSEAAAREAESASADDEMGRELMELIDGPITFFDLTDPVLD